MNKAISFALVSTSLMFTAAAWGSLYKVSGTVADTDGGPLPGALYRIYAPSDSVMPVVSNVTDSLGRFSQPLDSAGNYSLNVEYLGMKPAVRLFSLSTEQPETRLDSIILSSDEATLSELVVTYRKPVIESDGSTLTYNMDEDPAAKSNSVLEMLRKVPMVTVDAEENVKVQGSSNFKILVNGKEDPMFSGSSLSTVLKAMPASSIRKIEVITEPGAKYDAEGTSGVLNIVTTGRQQLEGVFGNVNAWLNRQGAGASAYARTKVKNVAASINAWYNQAGIFPVTNDGGSTVINIDSEMERVKEAIRKIKQPDYNSAGVNLNLSWEPDTLNLVTLSGNYNNFGHSYSGYSSQRTLTAAGVERWSALQNFNYSGTYNSAGGQLSYQHTFGRQGHHIVASYNFGYNDDNSRNTENYDDIKGDFPVEYFWRENASTGQYLRHVGQLDYSLPLRDKHVVELGAKGTFMTNTAHNVPRQGLSEEESATLTSEEMCTEQFQNIVAAYAAYTGKFGKFTGKAGLRYEHTDMGLRYRIGDRPDFSSRLDDAVPNVSLSYNPSPGASMRLGYQMRISRPGLWSLNPYRNESIGTVSYGNPDLKSEVSHGLSFSYNNYGGKLGGGIRAGYDYVGNGIMDYMFAEQDIIHTTYANIGRQQTVRLDINGQWTIIPDMSLSIFLSGYYKDMKADAPRLTAQKSGWGGNFNVDWNYRIPIRMRFNVTGGAGSPWFDIQYRSSSWYYYGVSVSQSLLKEDALTLSLNATNFLNPIRTYRNEVVASNVINKSWSNFTQWQVGFSITYRFGSLKSDVRRTAADVTGDDAGSGSGSSGKGGNT